MKSSMFSPSLKKKCLLTVIIQIVLHLGLGGGISLLSLETEMQSRREGSIIRLL